MAAKSNLVKSVIKAMDLLELLNQNGELSIGEINLILGWDKSTIHRLLSTLKEKKYVRQNPDNQKYVTSMKLFEMGNLVVERLGFRRQCQPFMEELALKTRETVNLAIQDGKDIIYIDKIESSATIKVDLGVGKRLPMYCTGLGKAILAYLPEDQVDRVLAAENLTPLTDRTLTSAAEIKQQLSVIRRTGYSLDDEEYVEGLVCVAAPIRDDQGGVMAAISVAVPQYRYDEGEKTLKYTYWVREIARRISDEVGKAQF
jgi:IclR family transcriptional regulator, KDG regulon repressor